MALKARATPPICGKHISRPMKLIKKPRTSETDVSVNLRGQCVVIIPVLGSRANCVL